MRIHSPSVISFVLSACALLALWYFGSELPTDELVRAAREFAVWMTGGLVLGLLLMWLCPGGVRFNTLPIDPLVVRLATQWRVFLLTYAVVAIAWAIAVTVLRVGAWPMLMDRLFSTGSLNNDNGWQWNTIVTLAFVTLQVLFISGAGRVRVRRDPAPPWKLGISITVFATAAGLMLWALVAAYLQLTDRIPGLTSDRAGIPFLGGTTGLAMLGASWLFWMCVGWILARGVPRETALARMISIVFAGSWIEFAVALPVELVTREQTKDCPCSSGSWVALICAGPLLLWTIGPALFLLYRYERQQTLAHPEHARRVLQRKSRHARVYS